MRTKFPHENSKGHVVFQCPLKWEGRNLLPTNERRCRLFTYLHHFSGRFFPEKFNFTQKVNYTGVVEIEFGIRKKINSFQLSSWPKNVTDFVFLW